MDEQGTAFPLPGESFLRILVVSSVYAATPPKGYGGIERVVYSLVEALAELGHEVTLMAPPGSHCSGRTVEVEAYDADRPWKAIKSMDDFLSEEPLCEAMEEFLSQSEVDVIHDWSFESHFVLRNPSYVPFVISTCIPPPPSYSRPNLVACSRAHAELIGRGARHVHYGLPVDQWPYSLEKGDELIHIAKIARYKAQHLAILAAQRSGRKLLLAGNVEDRLYYNAVVRPLVALSRRVRYAGEIDGTAAHLQRAAALVQTPRWFDAFPFVVLEALASATPVIALASGGLPEQVCHGETGFLCNSVGELAEAYRRLPEIDPRACRDYAETHFSSRRMAEEYVSLYEKAIEGDRW